MPPLKDSPELGVIPSVPLHGTGQTCISYTVPSSENAEPCIATSGADGRVCLHTTGTFDHSTVSYASDKPGVAVSVLAFHEAHGVAVGDGQHVKVRCLAVLGVHMHVNPCLWVRKGGFVPISIDLVVGIWKVRVVDTGPMQDVVPS